MIDARDIPLALYVHLPWCVRKCPYCDFNSHAVPAGGFAEQAYVAALRRDLDHASMNAVGRKIVSVFFGGGTPSLFSAAAIASVLGHARTLLPFAADAEVTLEANPGTIERGRFADYAAAGVNRVSLGAQSFDAAKLTALGRIHGTSDIARAVGDLRTAGIDNFNLDLMYALPGQDLQGALDDLEQAIALEPAHLSHYQLTLEPATPFARRPPPGLPDDDLAWTMQVECQERLARAGYGQYEVSAYARAGRHCRHNRVYWEFGDYLGVGAGAHGKVTLAATGTVERTVRVRHPTAYLAAAGPEQRIAEVRAVPAADLPFEYCLNALRLVDGFTPLQFESRTGLPLAVLEEAAARAQQQGLLEWQADRCRATPFGRRFLNDLQAHFLPV
jgi:putative oxygen-independent coproporphyrinogen III oxidase